MLDQVSDWLPNGAKILLMADRFQGTPDLIRLCQERQSDYRLPRTANRLVFDTGVQTTTGACAEDGRDRLIAIDLTERRIRTKIGMIHDKGPPEPWMIAMSSSPVCSPISEDGGRWGMEAMLSDFQTRGFGLEDSQIRRKVVARRWWE